MEARFLIVMGVSGSGKTTVGRLLAEHLGWDFFDADDFHPPENIAKMTAGMPLDDPDRAPWLASLHELVSASLKADRPAVLACSALKESYRRQLVGKENGVLIVCLKGSYELILSRMSRRSGHYMRPDLLKSQFEALEEPENALVVDISLPLEEIVRRVILETFP